MAQLVRAPAREAGFPSSNPGPGENFSLKLTTRDLLEGDSEKLIFHQLLGFLSCEHLRKKSGLA